MNVKEFESNSPSETEAIGAEIAGELPRRAVLLVSGPLGAGKTTLVRGLAGGLGLDPQLVHSPSFSLVNQYPGSTPLIHVDLYRLESERDLYSIGLEELVEEEAVVVIEWAEKLPWTLPLAWRLDVSVSGETCRRIRLLPPGA